MTPTVQLPKKMECLFTPRRYKIFYGGRGAGRSWGVARALIVKGMERRRRIGCFREIQQSIKESVHFLLKDQIEILGVSSHFEITDRSIACKNGTEFIFEGLFRNVNRIKSLEALDIVWVEEAEKVSDDSWGLLTPTIRREYIQEDGHKEPSEIWITFNPKFEDDATYQRFVVNPPKDSFLVEMNYADNPWFPDVLKAEMENDRLRDSQAYQNIWLGKPLGSGRRVWPVFDRNFHVKTFPVERLTTKANCYMAMDPHSHYYPFCVWVAVIPKNDRGRPEDFYRHVYAEWPTYEDLGGFYHDLRHKVTFKESIAQLAATIKRKTIGEKVIARFVDPRFAKGAGAWNWSTSTEGMVQQFAKPENGGLIFLEPEIIRLDVQQKVIHSDMVFDTGSPISWNNDPSFSVDPSCKNVIASLLNHRLEDESEKESEKYKDASDALRICYAGFSDRRFEGLKRDKPVNPEVYNKVDYAYRMKTTKPNIRKSSAWRTV